MSAAIVEIAQAVVDAVNTHDFGQPITAMRSYLPRYSLEELNQVRVTVVAKDDQGERESRSTWQDEYEIDLAIQKRLTTDDETAEMDGLVELGQKMVDFLRGAKLPVAATFVRSAFAPLFDPEHLEQHHTLTTVITLTYRGWRG